MAEKDLEKIKSIQQKFEEKRLAEQRAAEAAAKSSIRHVVAAGETLSHIALKYYGSASKEKWMIIYEANKNIIGDNPNRIRVGQELVIPDIK